MKFIKRSLFIFLLPLFAFTVVHKFYVSITNVKYSEKDSALQITSRIFINDFEDVLKERYDLEANLDTEKESDLAGMYMEKYIRTKFIVEINGKPMEYQIVGSEYDNDVIIFYIEIAAINLKQTRSISIQNKVLTDLHDEQQNILHFKINDKKKSFVLMKNNDKGMLKL